MKIEHKVFMVACLLLIFGSITIGIIGQTVAQDESQISGYILDENDSSGIDGARVVLESSDDAGMRDETITDENGYFSSDLPEGQYTISITADGYNSRMDDGVYMSFDRTTEFYLSPEYYYDNPGGFGDDGSDSDGTYDGDSSDGDGDSDSDGDGDDGDDDGDDDDGDSNSMEGILPQGMEENASMLAGICLMVIVLLVVSFLIIACTALGIFVRLGKIKKDVNKLTEYQQQSYQQPPPQHRDYRPPPQYEEYEEYEEYPRRPPPPTEHRPSDAHDYPPPPPPPRRR